MPSSLEGADKLRARLKAISKTEVLLRDIQGHGVLEAKRLVPHRTRTLTHTIRPGRVNAEYAEIVAGGQRKVGYAAFVERGTKPHIIRPKSQRQRFAGPFIKGQRGQHRGGVLAFPATAAGRTLAGRPTAAARRNSPGLGASKFRLAGGIKRVGAAGPSSGSMRFYRSVQHPGTKAQPYLVPGLQKAVGLVGIKTIVRLWDGAA